MLAAIAVILLVGSAAFLTSRWAKAIKQRADGEPRGQLTPGAWVVVAVVAAFFVVTVILNLTGVW